MSFRLLIRVLSPRDGRCIESFSTLYVLFLLTTVSPFGSQYLFSFG